MNSGAVRSAALKERWAAIADAPDMPEVVVASATVASAAFLSDKDVTTLVIIVGPALPGDEDLRPTPGAIAASLRYGVDFADIAGRAEFTGESGSSYIVLLPKVHGRRGAQLPWEGLPLRVLLLGSGAGTPRDLRRAGAALARATKDDDRVVLSIAPYDNADNARALVEGYLLGAYRPLDLSSGPLKPRTATQLVLLVGDAAVEPLEAMVGSALAATRGTWLARTLTSVPSDLKTPQWLAERAVALADQAGLESQVWDEPQLAAEGFGGLLAVAQGSSQPARLVTVTYEPLASELAVAGADLPGSSAPQHVVIVGKGITFDTGGLALKQRPSMVTMKTDMAGAAVALATVLAAAETSCRHRVTAVLALAENSPGGGAYRPGDVIRTYDGTTVEIFNPDAEGRIALADALGFARLRLRPDVLIDVATLTGAAGVALGHHHAGLFTADDELAHVLLQAGTRSGEKTWRLPLVEEYRGGLDSDLADIRQIARGNPGAGAIIAALFVQKFAGSMRWAHLDIAGAARSAVPMHEIPQGATGFGVRLLLEALAEL